MIKCKQLSKIYSFYSLRAKTESLIIMSSSSGYKQTPFLKLKTLDNVK
jgi:hypothetical protein